MANSEMVSNSDEAKSNRIAGQDSPPRMSSGGRDSHAHQEARSVLVVILCRDTAAPVAAVREQVATPTLIVETLPAKLFDGDPDLLLCRTRCFDPTVGRWLTDEPVGFEADDGNLASYVGNDPT